MTEDRALAVLGEAGLRTLGEEVLRRCPIDPEAAEATISRLVETEMFGIASHGFQQLPRYARMLTSSAIDGRARPEVLVDRGAIVLIDGHHGVGHFVTSVAATFAKERAAEHGLCVVSVRNSNHFGAAFPYCADLAEAGYIVLLVTNAPPNMAPWGGSDRVVGNNPFAWGVPRGEGPPVVLDVACSVAAGSRLNLAGTAAGRVPAEWALDEAGRPTTDPAAVFSYLPFAGHKGYGIAVINEILAGVLSGSLFSRDLPPRQSLSQMSWDVGHLLIVIDPATLCEPVEFLDRMGRLAAMIGKSRLRPGFDRILLPGEKEYRSRERHRDAGVTLPESLLEELRALARS